MLHESKHALLFQSTAADTGGIYKVIGHDSTLVTGDVELGRSQLARRRRIDQSAASTDSNAEQRREMEICPLCSWTFMDRVEVCEKLLFH
jgi:hypothetical protein